MDSLLPLFVFIAIVFGFIGYAIRPNGGFALGLLLGPFGWLIAAVMRAGDKPSQIQQQPMSRAQSRQQIYDQEMRRVASASALPAAQQQAIPPPPRARNPKLKIARDGVELGEWSEQDVAGYLRTGELEGTDYYFDREAGEWLELVAHPKLSTP